LRVAGHRLELGEVGDSGVDEDQGEEHAPDD